MEFQLPQGIPDANFTQNVLVTIVDSFGTVVVPVTTKVFPVSNYTVWGDYFTFANVWKQMNDWFSEKSSNVKYSYFSNMLMMMNAGADLKNFGSLTFGEKANLTQRIIDDLHENKGTVVNSWADVASKTKIIESLTANSGNLMRFDEWKKISEVCLFFHVFFLIFLIKFPKTSES